MGWRSCYLCNRKKQENNHLMLHRFPKDNSVRKKWLSACCLNEKDDVTYVSICSNHFLPDDYQNTYPSQRKLLNKNAVPSQFVPNPPRPDNSSMSPTPENRGSQSKSADMKDVPSIKIKVSGNKSESDDYDNLRFNSSIINLTVEKPKTLPNNILVPSYVIINSNKRTFSGVQGNQNYQGVNEPSTDFRDILDEEEFNPPLKKRRYFRPRYISEITASEVATPRGADRIIKFVKEKIQKKNLKIRSLQKNISRIKGRVRCLEDLIIHLQEENTLSADAGEALLVMIYQCLGR